MAERLQLLDLNIRELNDKVQRLNSLLEGRQDRE
jgi:hypothetical protein